MNSLIVGTPERETERKMTNNQSSLMCVCMCTVVYLNNMYTHAKFNKKQPTGTYHHVSFLIQLAEENIPDEVARKKDNFNCSSSSSKYPKKSRRWSFGVQTRKEIQFLSDLLFVLINEDLIGRGYTHARTTKKTVHHSHLCSTKVMPKKKRLCFHTQRTFYVTYKNYTEVYTGRRWAF